MKISIKGIGVLGGFGAGPAMLEHELVNPTKMVTTVSMESSKGRIEVPALLADTSDLTDYVGKRALRRAGHYIRMALLSSFCALEDAGMLETERRGMGIIVATGYGATCNTFDFQQSVIDSDDPCGSPTKFANSVHNAAAGNISLFLNEMGPNLSVSQYDMSIPSAFMCALQWLKEGRVDTVLVGGVDEYCKVLGYYWHTRYNGNSRKVNGTSVNALKHAIIGEGACFFVLAREEDGVSPYGYIEDVQMGNFLRGRMRLPESTIFFLGADGYSQSEDYYNDIIPARARVASYTHVYGGIPVGPAFDIAIAALSARSDTIYGSLQNPAIDYDKLNMVKKDEPLGSGGICCLKLGADGAFGWITLNHDNHNENHIPDRNSQ
ncbi:MAG: beta-ketoacyl synthase chain length factor [Deltaproteobacteria bacterium]|nr:beta-ketoacyl synthase chain length factor [Deltaproteobacteria bacterium]